MGGGWRLCRAELPSQPHSLPVPGEVLVLVDFAGQRDDELRLKAGDIVRKVESGPEEGWLQGELAGKTGLFPRQFVQIEDGWWLGRKNGQVGAFPSNFVQELDRLPPGLVAPEPLPKNGAGKQRPKLTDETFIVKEAEQPEPPKKLEKPVPTAQSSPSSQPPLPSCKAEYCKAMFDYEPELQDELQLKRGDVILVLCKETEDEGWWEGECDGKRGLFPDNFVMLLQPVVPKVTAAVPSRSQESIFRPEKKVSSASKAELRPPREPKDANCFDAILVSNAKLSHPTTTRPKMPGRKPPSQPPASSPKAPLVPAKSRLQARELQSPESPGDPLKVQEKLSLEVLMAEIRSLQILMDLMRVQHQKDMEELKMEMQEERAKRMVLQVEIESMKQMPALDGADVAGAGAAVLGSELEELPATL
ncbi:SH3 domain-containing kinase-binding protein 1 [Chelonia mydas]|uniref:SH3 domain-containing kinase-binding protein 1 n=1 Tax=Chelonia mydas TaxID=8469 RepID=M7C375_CHEMY|nr:SH3 domain-containing kinase-binding protein 1 [Chelonia mydas]